MQEVLTMRIAVCADEQGIVCFSKLLEQYQLDRKENMVVRLFQNSTDFMCGIKGGEYDLIFLDMEMTGTDGIQAAQEIRKLDKNVKLVFLSLSPEFAMESYSVGAYYYLLKPVKAQPLFELLDRAGAELLVQEEQGFVLKNRDEIVRISFARLEYVEVINKTVFFHLEGGAICQATAALSDFEERLLDRPEFLKPHRSYLVNLNYIQTVSPDCVVTRNGHVIPVSRQRRSQVQTAYMNYLSRAENVSSYHKTDRPDGPWRILIVDDEPECSALWAKVLRDHGCVVETAEDGEAAFRLAAAKPYDCVLLDIMLPGEGGFSLCERLGSLTHAPVIFLSYITETDKQIEGFAAGASDYITKDTSPQLFWAKVETRIKLSVSERTQLCYGPLLLDLARRRVLIDHKELLLTPMEFELLWCLSEHVEQIITPEALFSMVRSGQIWDGGQAVQVHMSRLRRKLEKAWAEHTFIETVWGQGYRFVPY